MEIILYQRALQIKRLIDLKITFLPENHVPTVFSEWIVGIPPTPLDGGKTQVVPPVCLLSIGSSEPWQPRCVPGFGHRKQILPGRLPVSLESGLGGIGHLVSEEQRSREIRFTSLGLGQVLGDGEPQAGASVCCSSAGFLALPDPCQHWIWDICCACTWQTHPVS